MIPEEMREIFEEFVVEAKEHLDNLEQRLIEMEKGATDENTLNAAFRSMHTIKGGAGFLGLTPIVEVAHAAEDLLGLLRSGNISFSSEINDVLLRAVDYIRFAIDQISLGNEVEIDENLISDIKLAASSKPKGSEPPKEKTLEELLDEHGFSHLKGKPIEDILEELVLLPPDKRPMDIVKAIEELIETTKVESRSLDIEQDVEEEANEMMIKYAQIGILGEEAEKAVEEEKKEESYTPIQETKQQQVVSKHKKETKEEEGEKVLRIDVSKIETLMNLVGELVLERNRLLRSVETLSQEQSSKVIEELGSIVSSLDRIVGDLQIAVMKTRMQPVKKLFQKFPRVVRDLSRMLNKEAELIIEGEDTEMDKSLMEKLEDPLIHLLRNAIDHGIENPDERERLGKKRVAQIKLRAYYQGDRVFISVEDDGRGIDVEKVKRKALEKGLVSQESLDKMTQKEIFSLIFNPGFSTADTVSEVSGRGVGMDVVMTTVTSFRGSIDIWSEKNKGTRVTMSFPLTIGIIKSLIVRLSNRLFAIPIYSVVEIVSGDEAQMVNLSGEQALALRGMTIPLINLGEVLGVPQERVGYVVVCMLANRKVAITVEDMIGDEEIVIKPLGRVFGDVNGISGATITGDGSIVLILDPVGLLKVISNEISVEV